MENNENTENLENLEIERDALKDELSILKSSLDSLKNELYEVKKLNYSLSMKLDSSGKNEKLSADDFNIRKRGK